MEDKPTIRDEALPSLAIEMVQFLCAGPADEDELRQNFGDKYREEGINPLLRYAIGRFPVIERGPDYYRCGAFRLIPESWRCRVVLRKEVEAEYLCGQWVSVADKGTVWNAWRLPKEEEELYPFAMAGDCKVVIWKKYGNESFFKDSFFLSEGRDLEIVPWRTPLVSDDHSEIQLDQWASTAVQLLGL